MPVSARIDQLRVDPHAIARALHAAFYDVRNAKFVCNLEEIPFGLTFVLHYAPATDDFQVGDLRQISENFVLHAISKEGVIGIAA